MPAAGSPDTSLYLDHLTVIAPSLAEGVAHVRTCLDLDVPFGQRHDYMGSHNHLLQLGGPVYLEIVALDPAAPAPAWPRWFGLDDMAGIRAAWEAGRRLRGWVARCPDIAATLAGHAGIFDPSLALPPAAPAFDFAYGAHGSLPLAGAVPNLIDRRGKPRNMAGIADLGARLAWFTLEHTEPAMVTALYASLGLADPPRVSAGPAPLYRAGINTPGGLKILT